MTTTAHTESPATSQDLAAELLRRRRKKLPRVTMALVLAVTVGAGLVGGIEIQKHYGTNSTSSSSGSAARSAFASRFGGAAGAGRTGGFAFGGGAGGGATFGTVTLIKGSTLYVTAADGNTVLVHTAPTARVTKTVTGSLQTIHPGDAVSVTGTQAANGSYTASAITITSAANG